MEWLLTWQGLATIGFICWMAGLIFGIAMMKVAARADEQNDAILRRLNDECGDQGGYPMPPTLNW